MGSRRLLSWLTPRSLQTNRPRKQTRLRDMECLEDRTVPTIIYNPVFGVETDRSNDNDEFGSQPQVYLEFWGQYWTGAVGQSQIPLVQAAASQVVNSKFFTIVNQYGGDGTNMSVATTGIYVQNNSDPPNLGFDSGDIDDAVQTLIDNGTFPESDADASGNDNGNGNDHSRIYIVITPPNIQSDSGTGVAGFNTVGSDIDLGTTGFPLFLPTIDDDDIGECWVWTGNNSDNAATPGVDESQLVSIDQFSLTFSHEVAEIMSDWDSEGYKVNPGAGGGPGGSGNQIGDYEGNAYAFRMSSGVDVQPQWSRQDSYFGPPGAWAVYDGTNQKFFLDGDPPDRPDRPVGTGRTPHRVGSSTTSSP